MPISGRPEIGAERLRVTVRATYASLRRARGLVVLQALRLLPGFIGVLQALRLLTGLVRILQALRLLPGLVGVLQALRLLTGLVRVLQALRLLPRIVGAAHARRRRLGDRRARDDADRGGEGHCQL